MKRLGFAIFVLVFAAQVAYSQSPRIVTHDQKVGNGKVTTIELLTPVKQSVPASAKPNNDNDNADDIKVEKIGDKVIGDKVVEMRDGPACVTLCASEWQCGRCFTDERNRRWCLCSGSPVVEKPALMKGWILQGEATAQIFFVHESGAIYRRGGVLNANDRVIILP